MMTVELTAAQRRAIDHDFGAALLIAGPSRSGKTTALAARIERYRSERGEAFVRASHPAQLVALATATFEEAGHPVQIVDEVVARRAFHSCAEPLLDLTWDELERKQIDPEVAALRSPERFIESVYRLIRKLRDAAIDPEVFLSSSLAGATKFYANPPNFAHADLLLATKDAYRDSLSVTPAELQRQYRRELDLTKIVAALYASFVERTRADTRMSASDAIAEALVLLAADASLAQRVRARYAHAFADEMQEATIAQRRLLEAIYGPSLAGVTLAGDAKAAMSTLRGARPDIAFAGIETTVELDPVAVSATLELHRARTIADEAAFVAEHVRGLLERGVPAEEIALLFRSSADVQGYTDALIARDIPVAVSGDLNVFCEREALDALALLWNVWDPFRHEWMLRTLGGRAIALSDASIATLCADPPDPQTALFILEDEPSPTARSGRWDPKRDVRLGWNVLRGDQDAQLNPQARERVQRFRALRAGWIDAMVRMPFERFVRTVWSEGLALSGTSGSARAASQQWILRCLLERLQELRSAMPEATLGDLLDDIGERAEMDGESLVPCEQPGYVHALSIDATRGRSFAHVIVPDARAGSFPRWYVPDAFLWSPKFGMIPRENAGDASASRTAKFSYYIHVAKARDTYNKQERCAFEYALSRARAGVLVTASGTATRGVSAPEFLEELRARR
jgi:superfamily I DNA/RNA helicase